MTDTQAPPAPFDWDSLVPAIDAPAPKHVPGSQTNVRTAISAAIRKRAEDSLASTMDALNKAKAAGKEANTVPPQWKLQPTPTLAVAEQFVKDIRKYAQYRPAKDAWGETPLEFYVPGSPTGQVTARAAAVVISRDPVTADVSTRSATPEEITAATNGKSELQFGVRYAVKPLESRNPPKTAANGSGK